MQSPQQKTIRDLIAAATCGEGEHATGIDGLSLYRRTAPTEPVYLDSRPGLAFVAQGSKSVMLGNEHFRYGENEYLLISIGLPMLSQVTEASPERPHYCFVLDIDMLQIASLANEMAALAPAALAGVSGSNAAAAAAGADPADPAAARGIGVSQFSAPLLDASVRLLNLLCTPHAIPVLAPLIKKEIAYHLLSGPQGARLIHMASVESQTHQIGRAVEWIKENYMLPLRIDALAARVNMSVSSLHHQFKALTAMTPMQYQKLLRLQGARRLMLIDMLDAGAAGHRVGYESASQFSREYVRQFGLAPGRDVAQARMQLQRESAATARQGAI